MRKILSLVLALLLVFSAMPLTMVSANEKNVTDDFEGLPFSQNDIYMLSGAQIRLNNVTGLRFLTKINVEALDSALNAGYSVEMGTLIGPFDLIGETLDIDDITSESLKAVDVKFDYANYGFYEEDEIAGSIVNIKEKNYCREFAARGYIKFTKEGETTYVYSKETVCRSVSYVAEALRADNYQDFELNYDLKLLVDKWADAYDVEKSHNIVVDKAVEATCVETGLTEGSHCAGCKIVIVPQEIIPINDNHKLGDWNLVKEPTFDEEGMEQCICTLCNKYEETRKVDKVAVAYVITLDDGSGVYKQVRVAADGKYSIENPEKIGYTFEKWVDEKGNEIPSNGEIFRSVTLKAVYRLDGTDTVEELVERIDNGVKTIKITSDIVIDKPIYITSEVNIYADEPHALIRDPEYAGDLFVVGTDESGANAIAQLKNPYLTIGQPSADGSETMLTIDGNAENMAVEVCGTAFFIVNSGTVDMYSDVKVCNLKKSYNERSIDYDTNNAGGAAVINIVGTFNMYGGIIENANARIDNTSAGAMYGGAIYNNCAFNMYGGVIRNCSAYRGGAVYNARVTKMRKGIMENNTSVYGGAICLSGSILSELYVASDADLDIYEVEFKNNTAAKSGGAIYSYSNCPVIIYGNTLFENNSATGTSGGAIYTSGTLTIRDAYFKGNTAEYYGGAVYHFYAGNPDADELLTVRIMQVENSTFDSNEALRGGAVAYGVSYDDVTLKPKGNFVDCEFINNKANARVTETPKLDESGNPVLDENGNPIVDRTISYGQGGSLWVTSKTVLTATGCKFSSNYAGNIGGAIASTGESKVTINNSEFTNNTAYNGGGAINAYGSSTIKLEVVSFEGNKSEKHNGGALYISNASATIQGTNTFSSNSAVLGGAIHITKSTVNMYSASTFTKNTANNGGAVYMTNAKGEMQWSVFTNNVANENGGAVYVTGSTYKFTRTTAKSNTAVVAGGAMYVSEDANATISNGTVSNNTANEGGAVYVAYKGNLTVIGSAGNTFEGNKATSIGGAMYFASAAVAGTNSLTNCKFISNTASSTGGALYIKSGSIVELINTTAQKNSGKYGGFAYLTGETTSINLNGGTFTSNTATSGGAIYLASSDLIATKATFNTNSATKVGGAIAGSGATVNTSGITYKSNSAADGGAVYMGASSKLTDSSSAYNSNTSTTTGGAISLSTSIAETTANTYTSNSSVEGGAVYVGESSKLTDNGSTYTLNNATNGGAVYVGELATLTDTNSIYDSNSANKGGAVFVAYKGNIVSKGTVGSEFKNNSAQSTGGAIHIEAAAVAGTNSLTNSKINNNTCPGTGGAIYIKSGSIVELNNVSASGNEGKYGGVVYTTGATTTLTVNGGEYTSNTATQAGVFYAAGVLNVSDAVFTTNTSTKTGGAIVAVGGTFTSSGNTYIQNTSAEGGAIYSGSNTVFTDVGSTYTSNSATDLGGAMKISSSASVTITDATVKQNVAPLAGGIYITNATVEIIGGVYEGNDIGSESTNLGGAIYVVDGTVNVDDAEFKSNKAYNGAAIYLDESGVANTENATFTSNTAANVGGAIYVGGLATLVDNGSKFDANTATNGGAVYVDYKGAMNTIGDKPTEFANNTATTNAGAIYFASAAVAGTNTLTNCVFTSNTSSNTGGALYVKSGSIVVFNNLTATSNVGKHGGFVYITGASTKLTVNGGTVTSNTATSNAGAFYIASGTINAENVTFTENSASKSGGAIVNAGTFVSSKNIFKNNSAADGGAVYNSADSIFNDEGSTYIDNTATTNGGAVFVNTNAAATMKDSVVKENVAISGGGVYVSSSSLDIIGGTYEGNDIGTASTNLGGAVYVIGGVVNVDGAEFKTNKAYRGSAIYVDEAGELSVEKTTFANNNSSNAGGAIFTTNTGKITIDSTEFNSNSSGSGGALYLASGDNVSLDVTNTTFTGNTSTGNAGAVYVASRLATESVVFTDCTFTSNTATSSGGGLYVYGGSNATLNNVTARNNHAKYGGIAYVTSASTNLTVKGATIAGNTATKYPNFYSANASNFIVIYKSGFVDEDNATITWSDIAKGTGTITFVEG